MTIYRRSMPDIAVSTENVLTADKSTECDEHMDATMTSPRNHMASPGNHVTPPRNHVTSPRNHLTSPRRLSLYREEDSNKLSDDDNNRSDNDSIATTPSTISNCTRYNYLTMSVASKTKVIFQHMPGVCQYYTRLQ